MTYFTDNPLERMMQQKPGGGRDARPPAPPRGHRCSGCSSYGRVCFGLCHRDLIIKQKPKEGETGV